MSEQPPERLFSTFLRVAFVGCIIALAVLAWLPADIMTRSILGGHAEHFIAYLGTTTVMGLAFQKRPRLAVQCALLIAYAAILEMGQLYSPSRHASFQDFAFSSSAVIAGGLLLWITRARLSNWLRIN
jgi:VanZ family protein